MGTHGGEACLLGDSQAVEQMEGEEEGEEEQISCFVFKWTNMNSKFYEIIVKFMLLNYCSMFNVTCVFKVQKCC